MPSSCSAAVVSHFCEFDSKCFVPLPCWVTAPYGRSFMSFVCAWHPAAALLNCCKLKTSSHSSVSQHVLSKSVAPCRTHRERPPPPLSTRTPLGNRLPTFRGNIVVTLGVETSNQNWICRPCRRGHNCISKFQTRGRVPDERYPHDTVPACAVYTWTWCFVNEDARVGFPVKPANDRSLCVGGVVWRELFIL